MDDWISFWDSDHPIYVSARHREVHNRLIADAIRAHVPRGDAVVLDYGCGEALHAERVAEAVGRLILCDAGPNLLATLDRRFKGNGRIEVRSPEEVAHLADHTIDMVVMNSVAQYLRPEETDALLADFHRLLKPDGLLLVGDVIPRDTSSVSDVAALLRFAAANGFLIAALGGLVRTVFSGYLRLRSRLKLTRYDAEEMIAKLKRAGFSARRIDNLGHDRRRMTFAARHGV
jgi:ubiquinone/menaquinone biosynthesis C-methylase UbiE